MAGFERREADWLPLGTAVRRVLDAAWPLPLERVPLQEALGRALAEPLAARATLPPWDNSAMDGYALRASDVRGASLREPVRLRVKGEVHAGRPAEGFVEAGEAIRIMTGAPIPGGADSVIRVEHTDAESEAPGWVVVLDDADLGRNIRPGGRDVREGEVVLQEGTSLGPGQIAVVAALGHTEVAVRRRPIVAVLSNGNELRSGEGFEDVRRGRGVPETNGPALLAGSRAVGAAVVPLGIARDEPSHIRERVAAGMEADVLVTSGGASMGEADLLKRVLGEIGLEVDFWRARMRPGSPFSLGRLPRPGREPLVVLGLPGNPASAYVTFEVFVRPFLLRMAGHARCHRRTIRAVAGEDLPSSERLTFFHRVTLEDGVHPPVAHLAGHQGSGLVRSLGLAQGLAVVPGRAAPLGAGEPLDVILLDDGPGVSVRAGYEAGLVEG